MALVLRLGMSFGVSDVCFMEFSGEEKAILVLLSSLARFYVKIPLYEIDIEEFLLLGLEFLLVSVQLH